MYLLGLYIIVAALADQSVSLKTFDPQCTHPDESVHVVESANTRGTLDILLVTLPTLFVCTWTVQHLNIPQKEYPASQSSIKGKLRKSLQEGWPKFMWMLITVIAPEIVVAFAFQDWMLARRFFKILDSNGDRQNMAWKKTHVFFANMGGFVLTLKIKKDKTLFYDDERMLEALEKVSKIEKEWRKCSILRSAFTQQRLKKILYNDKLKAPIQPLVKNGQSSAHQGPDEDGIRKEPYETLESDQPHPTPLQPIELQLPSLKGQETQSGPSDIGTTQDIHEIHPACAADTSPTFPSPITQQTYENVGNSMRRRKKISSSKDSTTEDITLYLNAIQLYIALKLGLIKELPQIEEKKFLDKSKSDSLIKLYALVQVAVFLVRIIRQYAKGLPISQLEMAVLAFCLCCCLAYCFYWSKPQSVMVPEDCPKVDYDAENLSRPAIGEDIDMLRHFGSIDFIKSTFVPPFCTERRKPTAPIPNDAMDGVFFTTGSVQTHYAEFAAVLAGVVFGALYFMAWSFPFPSKVEMIMWRVSAGLTAAGPILYDITNICMTEFYHDRIHHTIFLFGIAIFYLAARLFLVVEMFRTLLSLPPSVFAS